MIEFISTYRSIIHQYYGQANDWHQKDNQSLPMIGKEIAAFRSRFDGFTSFPIRQK